MKEEVWFWTNDLDILGGEVNDWIKPNDWGSKTLGWKQDIHGNRTRMETSMIAKIRTYNGFSIHLPAKRLFDSEAECITALREHKLDIVLD